MFKYLWKAWDNIKHLICIKENSNDNHSIYGTMSIWWNLKYEEKYLVLLQGCSTKLWDEKGIRNFDDIVMNGKLL